MDRAGSVARSERAWGCRGSDEECLLPSRADAVSALAAALEARRGPVLLTGEAGVGKTWACRRLREVMAGRWRWATVDLTPAIADAELLRLIVHALGFETAGGPAELRAAVADFLAEAAEDGERWGLIVDEGHNGSVGVLEELRVLGNRLGERGGFAGIVLVGQSALARRLTTRPLAALQSRISAHVHLRPLAVDELRDWLTRLEPGRAWDDDLVERLHRETGGNPGKVLSRSIRRPPAEALATPTPTTRPPTMTAPAPAPAPLAVEHATRWDAPPVGPEKPPIRFGDGMIEVGWEPAAGTGPEYDDDDDSEDEVVPVAPPAVVRNAFPTTTARGPEASGSETVVEDHYAALQAWTEWAQNQGRHPVAFPPPPKSPRNSTPTRTRPRGWRAAPGSGSRGNRNSPRTASSFPGSASRTTARNQRAGLLDGPEFRGTHPTFSRESIDEPAPIRSKALLVARACRFGQRGSPPFPKSRCRRPSRCWCSQYPFFPEKGGNGGHPCP